MERDQERRLAGGRREHRDHLGRLRLDVELEE